MLVLEALNGQPDECLELATANQSPQLVIAREIGGGFPVVPLSLVRYVDGGTAVPAAQQTGSIVAPFSTVQAAVDSLGVVSTGVVFIAPGTYLENVVVVASAMNFIGLTSNRLPGTLPVITSITKSGTNAISLQTVSVGTLTASAGCIVDLAIVGDATIVGQLTATQSTFSGLLTVGNVGLALSCSFQNLITLTTPNGVNRFSGSNQFFAAADIVGPGGTSSVLFDAESNSRFRGVSNTITTVPTVRVEARLGTASVVVAVPALVAGATGEAAVSVAGTELDGITTANAVAANPPVAALAPGVGLGNGGFLSCRVTATNTITFTFLGALTGGNATFQVTRLT